MRRELVAEGVGTALLLYVIVGSGIVAEGLGADQAGQLLAHAIIVGLGIGVLVLLFQTVSGSHFNPSVTVAFWREGRLPAHRAAAYSGAQVVGALAGVAIANVTFALPAASISTTTRDSFGAIFSEGLSTFVLVLVILALVRLDRASAVPIAVGAWVATIIFATASTGFANPAVTLARVFTDSYTGISPSSTVGFIVAQIVAALVAVPAARILYPTPSHQPSTV